MASQTLAVVPSQLYSTGLSCTAAARTILVLVTERLPSRSQRPGIEDECAALPVQQNDVQHIERVDRANAFDQRAFAVAVQCLQREAAREHLAAFAHELLDLAVEVLMTGKCLIT